MGMLTCPLCCNDEFHDQFSLRYHLLSMIENIHCSACNERFDSILDLANHLNGNCGFEVEGEKEKDGEVLKYMIYEEDSAASTENLSMKKIDDETILDDINTRQFEEPQYEFTMDAAKSQQDVGSVVDVEVACVQTIETNGKRIKVQVPKNLTDVGQLSAGKKNKRKASGVRKANKANEEPVKYSCSSCAATFSSITEHIKESHKGQEVAVKVLDDKNDVYNLVKLGDIEAIAEEGEKALAEASSSIESNASQQIGENIVLQKPSSVHPKIKEVHFSGDAREFLKWRRKVKELSDEEKMKEMAKRFKWIAKEDANEKVAEELLVEKPKKIQKFFDQMELLKDGHREIVLKNDSKFNSNDILLDVSKKKTEKFLDQMELFKDGHQEIILKSDSKFNSKDILLDVSKKKTEMSIFTCTSCQEEFGNTTMFRKHCLKSKSCSGLKNMKTKCLQMVTDPTTKMDAKLKNKSDDLQLVYKAIRCGYCDKVFTKLGAFRLHMKQHKNEDKRIFSCIVCHTIYSNNVAYQKHLRTHLEESNFTGTEKAAPNV